MDRHGDQGLREEFQRLRSETVGSESVPETVPERVPDFRAMLEKAKADAVARPDLQVVDGGQSDSRAPRRRLMWIGGWATAAVAATLAGVLLTGDRLDADMEFERLVAAYSADVSSGALRSPTSGLLNVLGMNLTRSVPLIGTSIRSLDPGQLPNVPDPGGRDG